MAPKLTIPQLTPAERDFLKERSYDKITLSVGWIGGLDKTTHDKYTAIMRKIDPDYSPTPWCDHCVKEMAKKVWDTFGEQMEQEPAEASKK